MMVRSRLLDSLGDVSYGFSSKEDENLSYRWGDPRRVLANRRALVRSVMPGWKTGPIFRMAEVHGTEVQDISQTGWAGEPELGGVLVRGVDGLLVRSAFLPERPIVLAGTFADCLSLFAYDPISHVIGIAHAGWRGVVSGMCLSLVTSMVRSGCNSRDLVMFLGPSIHSCCFHVDDDVIGRFRQHEHARSHVKRLGKARYAVDLQAACRDELVSCGVRLQSIESSGMCTACDRRFFSHRREGSRRRGLNMGVIACLAQ